MTMTEYLIALIQRETVYKNLIQYDFYEAENQDFYLMDGELFGEKRELKIMCDKMGHHTHISIEHRKEGSENWQYLTYFERHI